MNNEPTQPDWNTNPQKPVAFCQNCGKSLDSETVRKVGSAVYCEPCLAARLAGAPPLSSTGPSASGHTGPGYGPVFSGGPRGSVNGTPIASGEPNPGLAALLGLIPGVGAMYNEQYAKGIAHLLIFAVLVMLSHISGIFGLFVMGWICYMSIEAHHTAKARRDGTALPNPFGLNDIGERMGFGKTAWPAGPDFAGATRDAATAFGAAISGFKEGVNARPGTPPPASAAGTQSAAGSATGSTSSTSSSWGAPSETYRYANGSAGPAYAQTPPPYSAPYTTPPYGAHVYGTQPASGSSIPPLNSRCNRFPAGAVWLIGLGMFFLLNTLRVFRAVPGSALVGVILLILGVWTFLRRMTETGTTLADDGTPGYNFRVLRALRGSIWLIAFGLLALLDSFRLASWHYSWPWIIILVGVMMLLKRTAYHSAVAAAPAPSPAYVEGWDDPPVPPSPSSTSGSTRPDSSTHQGGL